MTRKWLQRPENDSITRKWLQKPKMTPKAKNGLKGPSLAAKVRTWHFNTKIFGYIAYNLTTKPEIGFKDPNLGMNWCQRSIYGS